MTLSAQPQPEAAATPKGVLIAAASRLARQLAQLVGADKAYSGGDVLECLDTLVEGVSEVLDGNAAEAGPTRLLRPILQARLLRALTDEVLAHPVRSAEEAEAVLRVVQVVRQAEWSLRGEGAEDLRSRLMQPDAFELLVEVAHDLRSPLTSILFLSEALRTGHSGPVNDLQRSQLGLMYSAALGLASVTSDIVDLARDGKGLIEAEPELYSVAEVFQGVEDLVRPMAEEKGIELRVEVQEYERSQGHPAALNRVLLNLTTNALKFTEHGYVALGAKRVSRQAVEFYVRDTGRGISEERQRDLFQPFKRRMDEKGHFFSGSGVGLTIVRRLVRSMGSDLVLQTAPDWGTRFSFVLDAPPVQ